MVEVLMTPTSESSDNLIYDDNEELKTEGATPEGINSDIKGAYLQVLGETYINVRKASHTNCQNGRVCTRT